MLLPPSSPALAPGASVANAAKRQSLWDGGDY